MITFTNKRYVEYIYKIIIIMNMHGTNMLKIFCSSIIIIQCTLIGSSRGSPSGNLFCTSSMALRTLCLASDDLMSLGRYSRTELSLVRWLIIIGTTCISPLSPGGGGWGGERGALRHDSVEQQSNTSAMYIVSTAFYKERNNTYTYKWLCCISDLWHQ